MRNNLIVCERRGCFGNQGCICRVLAEPIAGKCPFYKSKERHEAELSALKDNDMDAYRAAAALDEEG